MLTARSLVYSPDKLSKKTSVTTSRFPKSIQRPKSTKLSLERQKSQIRYRKLTNLTKNQMIAQVKSQMRQRTEKNPEWKYDHYRINNTFSVSEKYRGVEEFPHNNKKYNTQFLDKTLQGGGMNFTARDNGFFPKPKDRLYSNHYKPIVKEKREYNEDYELRASLFGKIDLDTKRERIMDQYVLQANPFHTQRSNALISTMRPARKHRFS